jgi:hypothetical protein
MDGADRVVARIVTAIVTVRIARIPWSSAKGSRVVMFAIAILVGIARQ